MILRNCVVQWLDQIREWWHSKSTKQKWQTIYDFGGMLAEFLGMKIYGDMKDFWYNYNIFTLAVYYAVSVLYTLWYFINEGDPMRGLQCTCTIGVLVTVKETDVT